MQRRTAARSERSSGRGPIETGLRTLVQYILVFGLLIAGWEIVELWLRPSALALPGPEAVLSALIGMVESGFEGISFETNIVESALRLALGLALSIVVGVPLGIMMGRSRWLRGVITPFITLFRPVPPFAWLAVVVVWFGIGELSKVVIVFAGTVTILVLNSLDGALRGPVQLIDAARTLGASRRQTLARVILPAALPQILAGLRVALAVGWSMLIAAEFFGAQAGIGVMILQSSAYLRTDQTFAAILILAILGAITDRAIALPQRRVAVWATK